MTKRPPSDSDTRFEARIAAHAPDGVVVVRAHDGVILYANAAMGRLVGGEAAALLGRPVSTLATTDDTETLLAPTSPPSIGDTELTRGWTADVRLSGPGGSTRWSRVRAAGFDDPEHGAVWVETFTDVTDQREAEDRLRALTETLERRVTERTTALRESEAMARALLDSATLGIIAVHVDGRIALVNAATEQLFGYGREALLGQPLDMLLPERFRDGHARHLDAYFVQPRTRAMGTRLELQARRADGSEFPVEISLSHFELARENLAVAFIVDLTERNRVEAERLQLSSLVENSPDFISTATLDGQVTYVNRAGRQLVGLDSVVAAERTTPKDYVPPDDQAAIEEEILPAVFERGYWVGERHFRHFETGERIPMDINAFLVRDQGTGQPHSLAIVARDARPRKAAEAALQESEALLQEQETLATLGKMAAVVAHEVRNPLAAIKGVLQVLRGRHAPPSQDRPIIDEVVERLDTLNALIEDLLVFARPTEPKLTSLALSPVIHSSVRLIRQDPALSQLDVDVAGPDVIVLGDPTLLQRLFLNLLLNAAHAMDGRGTIRIDVTRHDESCLVRISDTGPGIPADVRHRIFEPFFTTKSRGTGLGLAIAKRSIEHHQGTITLDCPAEGGTIVTVVLPLERPSPNQ